MASKIISQSREQLGSVIEIKLPEEHSALFFSCFNEIGRIEKAYSRFLDSSELTRVNNNLGKWQKVSKEYMFLLKQGLKFNHKTEGCFDQTLKSSLENLGYDKDYSFKPKLKKEPLLRKIREKIFDPIQIDEKKGKVLLRKEVEFGGLGKGYAVDKVAELLEKAGVDCYYINAGGDIYAKQGKGKPWTILLEHPKDPERIIGKVELDNESIACSAPNRRRWGKYHHLLNAKTRKPENSVKAVFVIAETCMDADAYATSLFTAGFEKAMEMYKALPVEVLIISSENKMFKSPGFKVEFF